MDLYLYIYLFFVGGSTVVQWLALSPHIKQQTQDLLQEDPGFESESRHFSAEFVCSPRVRVGLLRVLRFPPTVQKHVRWG